VISSENGMPPVLERPFEHFFSAVYGTSQMNYLPFLIFLLFE
jgi:hypothetical protein